MAATHVRYGYRRLTVLLLQREGWRMNAQRIYRLYPQEQLIVRIKSGGGSLADSAWQHPCQGPSTSVANVRYFIRRNTDDRQEFFNRAMARALKPIDSQATF